jgi:hypothetical protein
MAERVRELSEEARERRRTRPVLRGEAAPGNAWREYLLAAALSQAPGPRLSAPVPGGGAAAREASGDRVEQFLKSWGPLLRHLRAGTQCESVASPISSDSGSYRLLPHLGNWDALWKASVQYARLLAERGDYREAYERLTDLCLLGCDWCWNVTTDVEGSGLEFRRHALDELRSLITDPRFPAELLTPLEKELDVLDQASPERTFTLLNNTAQVGRLLLSEPEWPPCLRIAKDDLPAFDWRHGFSRRLLATDLFHRVDGWNRMASSAAAMPWPDAKRLHDSITEDLREQCSAFRSVGLDSCAWAAWARATHAKVRLLRVAVHFKRSGDVLPLPDPFGGVLGHRLENHHLKVWSSGWFGRGEVTGSPWDDADPAGSNRLVIEADQ